MFFWKDKVDEPIFHILYIITLSLVAALMLSGLMWLFNHVALTQYDVTVLSISGEYRDITSRGLTHRHFVYDYYCEINNGDKTKVYFYNIADDHVKKYQPGDIVAVQGERILSDGELVDEMTRVYRLDKLFSIVVITGMFILTFVVDNLPLDVDQWKRYRAMQKFITVFLYLAIPIGLFFYTWSSEELWWEKYLASGLVAIALMFNIITKIKE